MRHGHRSAGRAHARKHHARFGALKRQTKRTWTQEPNRPVRRGSGGRQGKHRAPRTQGRKRPGGCFSRVVPCTRAHCGTWTSLRSRTACVDAVVPKLALRTLCGDACSQKTIDMGGSFAACTEVLTSMQVMHTLLAPFTMSSPQAEDSKKSRSGLFLWYWEEGIAELPRPPDERRALETSNGRTMDLLTCGQASLSSNRLEHHRGEFAFCHTSSKFEAPV